MQCVCKNLAYFKLADGPSPFSPAPPVLLCTQVEVAREQARFEHVPRDDVEAEVRGLQEQLELLQAEHSAQLKEAYRVSECASVELELAKQSPLICA